MEKLEALIRWIKWLNRPLEDDMSYRPAATKYIPPILARLMGALVVVVIFAAILAALWDTLV